MRVSNNGTNTLLAIVWSIYFGCADASIGAVVCAVHVRAMSRLRAPPDSRPRNYAFIPLARDAHKRITRQLGCRGLIAADHRHLRDGGRQSVAFEPPFVRRSRRPPASALHRDGGVADRDSRAAKSATRVDVQRRVTHPSDLPGRRSAACLVKDNAHALIAPISRPRRDRIAARGRRAKNV